MTARRASTRLLALSRLLDNLAELYPDTIEHLDRQARSIDGWPTRGENAGIRATAELTTVEAAAGARLRYTQVTADLDAGINLLAVTIHDLLDTCHHQLRTRSINPDTPTTPRCTATGREGALEWADPTCADYATKGQLCAKCYMRERRYRIAHNLPTRQDAA